MLTAGLINLFPDSLQPYVIATLITYWPLTSHPAGSLHLFS